MLGCGAKPDSASCALLPLTVNKTLAANLQNSFWRALALFLAHNQQDCHLRSRVDMDLLSSGCAGSSHARADVGSEQPGCNCVTGSDKTPPSRARRHLMRIRCSAG